MELGVAVMPFDGEQLDELLSGFIDGQLSDSQRQWVEKAARDDAYLSERIAQLRRQAAEVAEVGRVLSAQQAPGDSASRSAVPLAQRVIAEARRQADAQGLPQSHHVFGRVSQTAEPQQRASVVPDHAAYTHAAPEGAAATTARPANHRQPWAWGLVVAAAASLLLAVGLWQWSRPVPPPVAVSDQPVPPAAPIEGEPEPVPTAPDRGRQMVGQFGNLAYVLVVDVQITREAFRERQLANVFAGAGIPLVAPVPATAEILQALDAARMIVDPQARPAEQTYLTVIRADMQALDEALHHIWRDDHYFPQVSLNMAIDARAALVREILNSTGDQFSLTDSFALPLAASGTAADTATAPAAPTPFPGTSDGVNYVSSSQRAQGWGSRDALAEAPAATLSTVLLVTHVIP